MKLQIFLKRNNVRLSKKTLSLCLKAERLLRKSIDPIHDISHVENMLDHLSYLLKKNRKLKKKIDMEVMVLSVFWHDIWSSRQKVVGFFGLLRTQLVEGMKSARIFWKSALKAKLNKSRALNAYYAIRKHSSIQFLPTLSQEAKVLIDLDKLELWNSIRLFKDGKLYVAKPEFYRKSLVRFYYFYSYKMGMYFGDLNKRFNTYAHKFWKQNRLISGR